MPEDKVKVAYVFYMSDGSKKEFTATRLEALKKFNDDPKAAFFVEKAEDPGFVWRRNSWCVNKEKPR